MLSFCATCAKSLTRFKSRLETRGVPRERRAISCAPNGSIFVLKTAADRKTTSVNSSFV